MLLSLLSSLLVVFRLVVATTALTQPLAISFQEINIDYYF